MSVKGWVQKCEEQEEREGWVKKDAGQRDMVAHALCFSGPSLPHWIATTSSESPLGPIPARST
jgi:hypothetical protein